MKHRSFKQLSELISKKDLEGFYVDSNHTIKETINYFNIDEVELGYLLRGYNLTRLKSHLHNHKTNFDKIKEQATYDKVYDYFIAQKHTINESAAHFNLSRASFRRLIAEYGIKKDIRTATATQKRIIFDTYGVENPFQCDEIKNKIKSTFVKRYGVEHALQKAEFLNKAIDTSIERYGEDFRLH